MYYICVPVSLTAITAIFLVTGLMFKEVLLKVGNEDFTVASAREKVRRWASLDSVIQWLKEFGLGEVLVKTVTEAEAVNDKK